MKTADRPNIIFVLTDDLGYGDIGVYYQNSRDFANNRHLPAFATPHLDAMAAAGLRMDRHYASSPVCAPARASLLSGRHQGHASVRDNQFDMAMERNHTLATVLREAGYSTAAIGKWGLQGDASQGWPGHPDRHGFDDFFGVLAHGDAHNHYFKEFGIPLHDGRTDIQEQADKCYSTDLFTAKAKHWITEQVTATPDQPFFLYLAYTAPHARLEVPTMAYPEGAGLHGGLQWLGEGGQMINTATGTVDSYIHPDYANATWDHDNNPATAEEAWPAHAIRHATMVRRLDDAMGDLMQLLEDLDIADNTLVIFTSDNGPHHEAGQGGSIAQDPRFFRTYGPLDGVKRDLWEGGIRVPTLVRWPTAIPAGRVSTHPSQFHDWMATFADVAGLPIPAVADGVSLVPDLTGEGTQAAGVVYSEYTTKWHPRTPDYTDFHSSRRNATRGHMQMVFIDGYKGVRYDVSSHEAAFRIHNVAADPQETTDLSGQPGVPNQEAFRDRVLRLRRAWPGETRAYDGLPVPAMAPPGGLEGLLYRVSAGLAPWVSDFPADEADAAGRSADGIDLTRATDDLDGTALSIVWEGFIEFPTTGTYTFRLTTDTGAVVRLHDLVLIDADFAYAPGTHAASGSLALQAGHHPIRIFSRHTGAEPHLHLEWSGPGFVMEPVPASAFQTSKADDLEADQHP